MRVQNLVLALLFGALAGAPLVLGHAAAEESKLKCETVKGYKCDARADGSLYNCRNTTTEKCTVVSGPGSGKTKPAAVLQPPKTSPSKFQKVKPLTTSPAAR